MNVSLKEAVHSCSWDTLGNLSSGCHELWETSGTSIPEVFQSQECWSSRQPTEKELVIALLDPNTYSQPLSFSSDASMLISDLESAQAFENGERIGKHGAAIWQLQNPDPHNPTYLMNAAPELSNDLRMCIPNGLLQKRTPYKNPTFGANITPRHTVVDLHLDQCRDGLVQCVGKSKKVILMWPATVDNMKILQDHSHHLMKFIRIGHLLQGGIIIIVDSSVGLVMYTGTIHMTITLEAGVLVGINWVAAESHRVAARCFRYEIVARLENDFNSVLAIYADQLEASLEGLDEIRHREVLEDWINICPLLMNGCKASSTSKTVANLQRVYQIFEAFLEGYQGMHLDYARHFRHSGMNDLNSLIQECEKTSRKRKRG